MSRSIALLATVVLSAATGAAQKTPHAQAARGRTLFFEGKLACGTCHALEGKGTAVGPDLKPLARLSPNAIVTAIRATRTQYVQDVKVKGEGNFPGMKADEKGTQIWDLSKAPPELRKFEPGQIESMKDNDAWKHPAGSADLSAEQLADIIAYIRWAAFGDSRGVKPDEIPEQ